MARARLDKSIERRQLDGFEFPLGVYPVEDMHPQQGYTVLFEPADGDEDGEWEEWPDRYLFEVLISAPRLDSLCRSLFALLPGRVYPILDVLGHDAYREVDPYVAYDLVGIERFLDGVRRFGALLYEDGLVGFGAMSEEPFMYVFVDEHKVVTIRCETATREKIERLLAAFDLEQVDDIVAADSVTHEHRSVINAPENRPDLLNHEEIIEYLQDEWGLVLNVEAESNLDEDGNEIGMCGWRCVVRCDAGEKVGLKYAEVLVVAPDLARADEMAMEAAEILATEAAIEVVEPVIIVSDRVKPESIAEELKAMAAQAPATETSGEPSPPPPSTPPTEPAAKPAEPPPDLTKEAVLAARWLP